MIVQVGRAGDRDHSLSEHLNYLTGLHISARELETGPEETVNNRAEEAAQWTEEEEDQPRS